MYAFKSAPSFPFFSDNSSQFSLSRVNSPLVDSWDLATSFLSKSSSSLVFLIWKYFSFDSFKSLSSLEQCWLNPFTSPIDASTFFLTCVISSPSVLSRPFDSLSSSETFKRSFSAAWTQISRLVSLLLNAAISALDFDSLTLLSCNETWSNFNALFVSCNSHLRLSIYALELLDSVLLSEASM